LMSRFLLVCVSRNVMYVSMVVIVSEVVECDDGWVWFG